MSAARVQSTGPGEVAGTDPREAGRAILGECHALPFLPELPERGLGADQVGRTGVMLADLPVDISTRGWRLSGSPGRMSRRAADFLARDSDALEEADELLRSSDGEPSPVDRRLVIRVVGPWSLAANLELPAGRLVLTDRGARRDLAGSLAEGVAGHAVRLAQRMRTGTRIVLDEPMLWHIAAGTVAGPSRFDSIAAVEPEQLSLALSRFADALRAAGVDEVLLRVPATSGPEAPARWAVVSESLRGETPLDGLCLDAHVLQSATSHDALDAAGTILGDGRILQLEGLPGMRRLPRTGADVERSVAAILALFDRLSAPRYAALNQLVLTPTVHEMTSGRMSAADTLAAVRRVADAAPGLAE